MAPQAVMFEPAIMGMADRGRYKNSAAALDLNAAPPPPASRIKPDYSRPSRTQAVREAMDDPMDTSVPVAAPGASMPGASMPGDSIHDHEGVKAKLAHIAAEIIKDETPYAEKKRALLQLAKMVDDEAKAGGEMPPEDPEAAMPPDGEPAETPPEETPAVPSDEVPPEAEEPADDESGMEDLDKDEDEDEEEGMDESVKALKVSTDPKDKELFESIRVAVKEEKVVALKLEAKKLAALKEEKIEKAKKLCLEAKLNEYREVTEILLEEVANAKDDRQMKAIVADKLNIAARQRPTSAHGYIGGGPAGGDITADQFVAMLNSRVA